MKSGQWRGYHRDAVTGYGISDAFRDAELLAAALGQALGAVTEETAALMLYQRRRDQELREIFEITCRLAAYPPVPAFVELQKAAKRRHRQAGGGAGRPAGPGRAAARHRLIGHRPHGRRPTACRSPSRWRPPDAHQEASRLPQPGDRQLAVGLLAAGRGFGHSADSVHHDARGGSIRGLRAQRRAYRAEARRPDRRYGAPGLRCAGLPTAPSRAGGAEDRAPRSDLG